MNRLAVILIGQYRTWPICSKYQFDFFASKAKQVDYYFVTWEYTNTWCNGFYSTENIRVQEDDILRYFTNHTLANFKIVNEISEQDTFYRMATLSKIANQLKQNYELEHNFVYDQVVETRPDIILIENEFTSQCEWTMCNDYEFSGTNIYDRHVNDSYFRTNSYTHNILSNRLYHTFEPQPGQNYHHAIMADYLIKSNLRAVDGRCWDFYFDQIIRSPECSSIDLSKMSQEELRQINFRSY